MFHKGGVRFRWMLISGALLLAWGVSIALGLLFFQPEFVQLLPGGKVTSLETALALSIAGAGLLIGVGKTETRPLLGVLFGFLVFVSAGLGFARYVQFSFPGSGLAAALSWLVSFRVGQPMSPVTAIALLATSIVLAAGPRVKRPLAGALLQWLILLMFLIALLSNAAHILDWVIGFDLFDFGLRRILPSWPTALGLLFLCVGMGLASSRTAWWRAYYGNRPDREVLAISTTLLLATSLISVLIGMTLFADHSIAVLKETLREALTANSRAIVGSVEEAMTESGNIVRLSNLGALVRRGGDKELQLELKRIKTATGNHGPSAIRIMAPNGREMAASGRWVEGGVNRVRLQTAERAWLFWRDGFRVEVRVPIMEGAGQVGEAAMEFSLTEMDSRLEYTRGLGTSGEVVICAKSGVDLDCYPSRLAPAAYHLPNGLSRKSLPMSYAMGGPPGVTITRDYRGQRVIAAYALLGDLGLGIVQKVDTDELYAAIRRQLWLSLWMVGLLGLTGGGVLFFKVKPTVGALNASNKSLQESEERFRTIFNSANDAIFIHDARTGAIVDVNQRMCEMYGYTYAEAMAVDVGSLSSGEPPYTQQEAMAWMTKAFQGEPQTFEWHARRKDGSLLWVEVNIRRAEIGGQDRMIVAVRDIEQRRRAEMKLREAQSHLQRIMEVSPAVTYDVRLDPDGAEPPLVTFHGSRIVEMVGYSLEAWQQPGFWEAHILADDRERVAANQAALLERGTLQHEYRFLHEDGRVVWIHDRLVLVRDEMGRPREIVGTWLDITERARGERDLQRINRFYSVLSLTNQAITRIHDESRLFDEVCRITVEEGGFAMAWIGMLDAMSEVVPVAHRGRDEGYLAGLMEKGVLRHNGPTAQAVKENRYVINDDTLANPNMAPWRDEALKRGFLSSAAFPINRGGKPVGALALYAVDPHSFTPEINRLFQELAGDVSFALDFMDQDRGRRQAEEQLRLLNEQLESRVRERTHQLEAANKELEAFSYSVSHDLRAPLRSIDGFSQILVRKYGEILDEVGKDYLQRVQRASQRMGELIDDLLELSRVSRAGIKKENIDLSRIAHEVIDTLRQGTPGREVEAVIQDGVAVHADGRLMKVVLENLLGNAWKFTARRDDARIEFGCRVEGDQTVFFVRDNGAGFDMQYANKLFGAFQRLHKAEEFDGTGIGLATVQRIIHRHAGSVWAEGEVGKGAAFFFTMENAQEGAS